MEAIKALPVVKPLLEEERPLGKADFSTRAQEQKKVIVEVVVTRWAERNF